MNRFHFNPAALIRQASLLLLIFSAACSTVKPIPSTSAATRVISNSTFTPPSSPTPANTKTTSPTPVPTRIVTTAMPTITITPTSTATPLPAFSFALNADMIEYIVEGNHQDPFLFRGVVEAIAEDGTTDFMITVGDLSPPANVRLVIDQVLGEDYLWYPVVGNHDLNHGDMEWLDAYNLDANGGDVQPNLVHTGPPRCENTTYSFDYLNAHFVVLNLYCDPNRDIWIDGAVVDALYEWLLTDLVNTNQEHIFVFGHEPAFPQPDVELPNWEARHLGDSLDQYPITRDRFWALLKEYNVTAYITAHTHSFSAVSIDEVWQLDIGHARGINTQAYLSTFVIVDVVGSEVTFRTYRAESIENGYILYYTGILSE